MSTLVGKQCCHNARRTGRVSRGRPCDGEDQYRGPAPADGADRRSGPAGRGPRAPGGPSWRRPGRRSRRGATSRPRSAAVAAEAGVDASMVMRYFGSKAGLFTAAATADLTAPDLLAVPARQRGEVLVRTSWTGGRTPPTRDDELMLLLRTAVTSEAVAARLQATLGELITAADRRAGRAGRGRARLAHRGAAAGPGPVPVHPAPGAAGLAARQRRGGRHRPVGAALPDPGRRAAGLIRRRRRLSRGPGGRPGPGPPRRAGAGRARRRSTRPRPRPRSRRRRAGRRGWRRGRS